MFFVEVFITHDRNVMDIVLQFHFGYLFVACLLFQIFERGRAHYQKYQQRN